MTRQNLEYQGLIWDQIHKSDEAKQAIFSSAIMLMSEIDTIEKAADKLGGLD